MPAHIPELSIIIPSLNEADTLPILIEQLFRQHAMDYEIIIIDGGSTDNTVTYCEDLAEQHPNTLSYLESAPGRAIQMNLGAAYARAPLLLFLHADTQLKDHRLLRNAIDAYRQHLEKGNNKHLAGHFGLRFIRNDKAYANGYYFYEAKTHLNRKDCINGDQGFLLTTDFFKHLGQFDESLPYMEDARLADNIFQQGRWITLPGVVHTSARRFETEGFRQRQILNSFLCNFQNIGLHEFFDKAREAYRSQDNTSTLQLKPFLKIIHALMFKNGMYKALQRWYHTGGYIADNAWQLAFSSDCKKSRIYGREPGECKTEHLEFYDSRLAWLITSPPCRAITGLLTFVWFYSLFITER